MAHRKRTIKITSPETFEPQEFIEVAHSSVFKRIGDGPYDSYTPEEMSHDGLKTVLLDLGELIYYECYVCDQNLKEITRGAVADPDGHRSYFHIAANINGMFDVADVDRLVRQINLSGNVT